MLGAQLGVPAAPLGAPAAFAPAVGDRVEVKWVIVDDETGETEIKWWGAKVLRKVAGKTDAAGRDVFTLSYDAEEGFESDEQDVSFIDEHSLTEADGDGSDVMPWRREGDAWEDAPPPKKRRTQPPPESDYEDELEEDEEEAAADDDDEDEYNPHADE
eukprot:scaffold17.g560.t1